MSQCWTAARTSRLTARRLTLVPWQGRARSNPERLVRGGTQPSGFARSGTDGDGRLAPAPHGSGPGRTSRHDYGSESLPAGRSRATRARCSTHRYGFTAITRSLGDRLTVSQAMVHGAVVGSPAIPERRDVAGTSVWLESRMTMSTGEDDPYAKYSDERIKHMEMLQAVVARLGSNGFVVKGWAITLAGAFQGFGITRNNSWLVLVGLLPTLLFWFLDSSFLRSERAFRMLFERVRTGNGDAFFMNATTPAYLGTLGEAEQQSLGWWRIIGRPSLSLFYGALAVSAGAIALFLAIWGGEPVQSA